jgi:hypothetical protein
MPETLLIAGGKSFGGRMTTGRQAEPSHFIIIRVSADHVSELYECSLLKLHACPLPGVANNPLIIDLICS